MSVLAPSGPAAAAGRVPGPARAWRTCCALLLLALGPAAALAAADAARGPDGLLAVPPLARVTDQAGVLTPEQRSALDARLADFETTHGSQIAIILVDSVQPEPIEDYAHRVGERWKIGRAGIGDGVLFIAAIKDRRMRFDVARSLEGAIPDVVASRLIRERIAPAFASGDYAAGLNAGLDGLFALILGEGLPAGAGPGHAAPASEDSAVQRFVGFVIGGLVFGSFLRGVFGIFGAIIAGGVTAAVMYFLFSSTVLAGVGGLLVFLLSAFARSAGGFVPGYFPGGRGSGGFGGGGFGGGGGGGGFSSGGGGSFSGGGASGSW
jgi:uncharacterized protein